MDVEPCGLFQLDSNARVIKIPPPMSYASNHCFEEGTSTQDIHGHRASATFFCGPVHTGQRIIGTAADIGDRSEGVRPRAPVGRLHNDGAKMRGSANAEQYGKKISWHPPGYSSLARQGPGGVARLKSGKEIIGASADIGERSESSKRGSPSTRRSETSKNIGYDGVPVRRSFPESEWVSSRRSKLIQSLFRRACVIPTLSPKKDIA